MPWILSAQASTRPQFPDDFLPAEQKFPKADNLLITKGKLLDFSLPKAENILKTSLLREIQKNGFFPKKCPQHPVGGIDAPGGKVARTRRVFDGRFLNFSAAGGSRVGRPGYFTVTHFSYPKS